MPLNIFSKEETLSVILGGDFQQLVGKPEGDKVDYKQTGYDLSQLKEQVELAKDVSAFCNEEGGIIVIGVSTRKDEHRQIDTVNRVGMVEENHINRDQCLSLIRTMIYPSPTNISVSYYHSTSDNTRGLWVIDVPEQQQSEKPFIVIKVENQENNREIGYLFGFFQRSHDSVTHKNEKWLQSTLRDGMRFEQLSVKLEDIQSLISNLIETESDALPPNSSQASGEQPIQGGEVTATSLEGVAQHPVATIPSQLNIQDRLEDRQNQILKSSGLIDIPYYMMSAYPCNETIIRNLFSSRQNDLVSSLNDPPTIRYGSFGLDLAGEPRIIDGERWQIFDEDYPGIMELWRDGYLVFAGPGDRRYLRWPISGPLNRINPVVVIESVLLFCMLYKKVWEHLEHPQSISYRVSLGNMRIESNLPMLQTGIGMFNTTYAKNRAQSENINIEYTMTDSDYKPEYIAYQIVSRIYHKFNATDNEIPLTGGEGDNIFIDAEKIQSLRR